MYKAMGKLIRQVDTPFWNESMCAKLRVQILWQVHRSSRLHFGPDANDKKENTGGPCRLLSQLTQWLEWIQQWIENRERTTREFVEKKEMEFPHSKTCPVSSFFPTSYNDEHDGNGEVPTQKATSGKVYSGVKLARQKTKKRRSPRKKKW